MKKVFSIGLLLILQLVATAQVNNSLNFDGIDDVASVPQASSLISGAAGFSMSFWIKPENGSPAFPNFDGFAGFRNNSDADFYILQLTATDVEARFRNSNGVNFDIISSSLILNAWQHFALTYNGTNLTLYHNGAVVGTEPASGIINNASETFLIGNLVFQTYDFYADASLDEVSLWSKALSAAEVQCLYKGSADTLENDLKLYYKCNQGTAAGSNTTIGSLINFNGTNPADLAGFSLNGTNSNFVSGAALVYNTTNANLCQGASISFQGQIINAPGTYYGIYTDANGCDSVVALIATATSVDTVVTRSGNILTAQATGATFQWLYCDSNYQIIPGATQQSLIPVYNGSYAVAVTQNGCTDTSTCKLITTIGIDEPIWAKSILIFPTSVVDVMNITSNGKQVLQKVNVFTLQGSLVDSFAWPSGAASLQLPLNNLATGSYLLVIKSEDQTQASFKFLKQ
jgi:hypothetical protein